MSEPAAHPREDLLAHAGFVRALARATLCGDSECEDLEQDVWAAALSAKPVEPSRQRPWLVAVLRGKAADLLRRRERRLRRERAVAAPPVEPSAADAVVRAESGRRLVHALLELDEPFRSAVLLRYLDGLAPGTTHARILARPAIGLVVRVVGAATGAPPPCYDCVFAWDDPGRLPVRRMLPRAGGARSHAYTRGRCRVPSPGPARRAGRPGGDAHPTTGPRASWGKRRIGTASCAPRSRRRGTRPSRFASGRGTR